jgi:hypothetical protein
MASKLLRRILEFVRKRWKKTKPGNEALSHEQIFAAGSVGPEPSAEYLERLAFLDGVVRECITVSRQSAGIASPTAKHFYASVLFTSLIVRGVSLAILAPHSPWAHKMIEHWDYASATVIVRTMLELRAAFHYLCVDACSDDEWRCRWDLLNLHDYVSRRRLAAARKDDLEQVTELDALAEELRDRLRANPHFAGVAHKRRLLNGQNAYLYPIEEMVEKAGIEKSTYRWLNILFSSHVHGLPMSYYRMGREDRGRGVPSPVEEAFFAIRGG